MSKVWVVESEITVPSDSDGPIAENKQKRIKKSQGTGSTSKKKRPIPTSQKQTHAGAHTNFSHYDSYTLFNIPTVTDANLIPTQGVRLSGFHVVIVLESGLFFKKQLNTNWKAEFDQNGMTRAT